MSQSPASRYPPWLSGDISSELDRATIQPCPRAGKAERNARVMSRPKTERLLHMFRIGTTLQTQNDAIMLRIGLSGNNRNLLCRLDRPHKATGPVPLLRFVHHFDRVHTGVIANGRQPDRKLSLGIRLQSVGAPRHAR